MKKVNLRDVGAFLLFLVYLSLIALGMVSCSARKTQTEISKESSKVSISDNSVIDKKSESNVKETKVITVDDKNETVTEETTFESKDPLKESFIIEKDGTKTILNNLKKTVKKTTQKNNTQSESKVDSQINKKEASKELKDIKHASESKTYKKQKDTEKEAFPWYYCVLIVGVILLVVWFIKKYTDKLWWI